MTDTEPQPDDMLYMAERAAQYYDLLRAQGIPQTLAVRMVGGWDNLVVVSAANYFEGRTRMAERSVSRRLSRLMGKDEE